MEKMDVGKTERLVSIVHSLNIAELVYQVKEKKISEDEYFLRMQTEQKAFNKIMKVFRQYNEVIKGW